MKVFISGPMTGIPSFNKPNFDHMEKILRSLGYDVYNPAWNNFGVDWKRKEFLALDIVALSQCDGIVQLLGWEKSDGCKLEHTFALTTGIPIYSQGQIMEAAEINFNAEPTDEDNTDPYEIRP